MRLLVISHNVFSETDNMGKTLSGYFKCWNKEELAQLYVCSEEPASSICDHYFRITDREALRSLVTRKCGQVIRVRKKNENQSEEVTSSGHRPSRSPLTYLARNLVWRLSAWRSKELLAWIDSFDPQAIFFASGDYSFTYRMALDIAKYKNIPLFLNCVDDYYFYPGNMGKIVHRSFMRQVKRVMEYSAAVFPICDKMARDYEKAFGKKCYTLFTPASFLKPMQSKKNNRISYIGNLGYGRDAMLAELGRTLRRLDIENKPQYIDVYSAETDPAILSELTHENGIEFHGRISADEVKRVMAQSLAVIHTESFEAHYRKRVRYSVSTKIADSLMSGTCILAYGPTDVASMEYLIQNQAAIIVTNREDLRFGLTELLQNYVKREAVIANAVALAEKNHNKELNGKSIAKVMSENR